MKRLWNWKFFLFGAVLILFSSCILPSNDLGGGGGSPLEPATEDKTEMQLDYFTGSPSDPDLILGESISSRLASGSTFEEFDFNTSDEGTYKITARWFADDVDIDLDLYDVFGNYITTAESYNNPEVLTVTLPADSRYTVEVYDYDEVGGAYTLSLSYEGVSHEDPIDNENNEPQDQIDWIHFEEPSYNIAQGTISVSAGTSTEKGVAVIKVIAPLRDAQYEIKIDSLSNPGMGIWFAILDKDNRFIGSSQTQLDGSVSDWATFEAAQTYTIFVENFYFSPAGSFDISIEYKP